jgi:hypothetical protein
MAWQSSFDVDDSRRCRPVAAKSSTILQDALPQRYEQGATNYAFLLPDIVSTTKYACIQMDISSYFLYMMTNENLFGVGAVTLLCQ